MAIVCKTLQVSKIECGLLGQGCPTIFTQGPQCNSFWGQAGQEHSGHVWGVDKLCLHKLVFTVNLTNQSLINHCVKSSQKGFQSFNKT